MDKPFLTFDEQINKLVNEYNLIIEDKDYAIEALSSISYYDLINGNKSICMENEKFINKVSIENLVSSYMFNKNIQGVLFKYATISENSFKTALSYTISSSFGEHEDDYLEIGNYRRVRNEENRERLRSLIKDLKVKCRDCKDTPTSHYRKTKNHIPPWILLKNISFSDSENLFNFLKKNEKEILFELFKNLNLENLNYDNKNKVFNTGVRHIRKLRNKIAHNLNFIDYRGSYVDKNINILFIDTLVEEDELDIILNNTWGMILSIVLFLNNRSLTMAFLNELKAHLQLGENINIGDMILAEKYCKISGIPRDYDERIIRYIENEIN